MHTPTATAWWFLEIVFAALDATDALLLFKSIFQDAIDRCVPTYIIYQVKKNLYCNSEVYIYFEKDEK